MEDVKIGARYAKPQSGAPYYVITAGGRKLAGSRGVTSAIVAGTRGAWRATITVSEDGKTHTFSGAGRTVLKAAVDAYRGLCDYERDLQAQKLTSFKPGDLVTHTDGRTDTVTHVSMDSAGTIHVYTNRGMVAPEAEFLPADSPEALEISERARTSHRCACGEWITNGSPVVNTQHGDRCAFHPVIHARDVRYGLTVNRRAGTVDGLYQGDTVRHLTTGAEGVITFACPESRESHVRLHGGGQVEIWPNDELEMTGVGVGPFVPAPVPDVPRRGSLVIWWDGDLGIMSPGVMEVAASSQDIIWLRRAGEVLADPLVLKPRDFGIPDGKGMATISAWAQTSGYRGSGPVRSWAEFLAGFEPADVSQSVNYLCTDAQKRGRLLPVDDISLQCGVVGDTSRQSCGVPGRGSHTWPVDKRGRLVCGGCGHVRTLAGTSSTDLHVRGWCRDHIECASCGVLTWPGHTDAMGNPVGNGKWYTAAIGR